MLLAGHQCVLLVITDGGRDSDGQLLYNDADRQLNGIVVDPGAPGDQLVALLLLLLVAAVVAVVPLTFGSY